MIGLALVTFVAVLASGITSSFRGAVNKIWHNADYAITAQNNFAPIPIAAADAVQTVPGVEAVGNVRTGDAKAFGHSFFATAVNPPGAQHVQARLEGGLDRDARDARRQRRLRRQRLREEAPPGPSGRPSRCTFSNGAKKSFVDQGHLQAAARRLAVRERHDLRRRRGTSSTRTPKNLYSFVRMSGGDTDANLAALKTALKPFPNAKAQTRQQFIDNQISGLNSILNILYVLLALSVIVSLFGIVNTLVLTVFERTREIGMLRAIGMTRRQVRRMIRHESVITALIGGVLGIVLGIVLGGLLVYRVDFIQFSLPVDSLIVFAIAAIVVGILAAIFPARRAARLNVLEALQYE